MSRRDDEAISVVVNGQKTSNVVEVVGVHIGHLSDKVAVSNIGQENHDGFVIQVEPTECV